MIARLSVAFAFSVLLHGLLLLAINLRTQPGNARYKQESSAASSRMSIQLAPASHKKKLSLLAPAPEKRISNIASRAPAQERPAVLETAAPATDDRPSGFSGFAWNRPFAPDIQRQMQMNYRKMYEAQARQQMLQQVRLVIARLQADIEQRLNRQHGERVEGKCVWTRKPDDASAFQCESQALARLMQDDMERLVALRKAMRAQQTVLDGFTVSTNSGLVAITYQLHPANTDSAP